MRTNPAPTAPPRHMRLIKAGRADLALRHAALRARAMRGTLAYTLESHALMGRGQVGRPPPPLPAGAAGRGAARRGLVVSLGARCNAAIESTTAIAAYMQSLALKMDDATVHFRLGMCFKDKA